MPFRLASQLLDGEAWSTLARASVGLAAERMTRRTLPHLATPADAAASLPVSERSMRRRLAMALVLCGLQSVAPVAIATGYTEVGMFRRAFRRWGGFTPVAMHAGAVQALAAAVARAA